jgi:hypothetical protein
MDNQHAVAKHYMILIGINAYPIRPLTSCVRDVQMIQEYLKDKLGLVEVHTLIASKSPDLEIVTPLKDPECWPTYRNITTVFERVTSQGVGSPQRRPKPRIISLRTATCPPP